MRSWAIVLILLGLFRPSERGLCDTSIVGLLSNGNGNNRATGTPIPRAGNPRGHGLDFQKN